MRELHDFILFYMYVVCNLRFLLRHIADGAAKHLIVCKEHIGNDS